MNPYRPLATLTVVTQYENVGDAWINRELIRLIAERTELELDLSRAPQHFIDSIVLTTAQHGRSDGLGRILLRQLSARLSRRASYHFISPGANFGELHGKRLFRSWILTGVICTLRLIGTRVILAGASYENLGQRHRRMLACRSRWFYEHLVRDSSSAEYAKDHGIRVTGIIPDLSLATPGLNTGSPTHQPPIIAYSFRVDQSTEHFQQVRDGLLEVAEALGDTVIWKPIVQVERDLPGMTQLTQALRSVQSTVSDLELVANDLTAAENSYTGSHYVLGNRLHGLLLGASQSAIPLAWIDPWHNVKIVRIFSELGLEHQTYSLSASDSAQGIATTLATGGGTRLDFGPYRDALNRTFDEMIEFPAQ